MPPTRHDILGLEIQELTALVESFGEPTYRAKQLFHALYAERIDSLDRLTNWPKKLKDDLASRGYVLNFPKVDQKFVSVDGTVRYLIGFPDGQSVETVWMPEGDDGESGD